MDTIKNFAVRGFVGSYVAALAAPHLGSFSRMLALTAVPLAIAGGVNLLAQKVFGEKADAYKDYIEGGAALLSSGVIASTLGVSYLIAVAVTAVAFAALKISTHLVSNYTNDLRKQFEEEFKKPAAASTEEPAATKEEPAPTETKEEASEESQETKPTESTSEAAPQEPNAESEKRIADLEKALKEQTEKHKGDLANLIEEQEKTAENLKSALEREEALKQKLDGAQTGFEAAKSKLENDFKGLEQVNAKLLTTHEANVAKLQAKNKEIAALTEQLETAIIAQNVAEEVLGEEVVYNR